MKASSGRRRGSMANLDLWPTVILSGHNYCYHEIFDVWEELNCISPGQDQVRTVTNESCIKMIKNSQNPFIINHKGFLSIGPVSEANQFSRFGRIRKEFSHIFDSFNHRRQNADSLQFQMRETRLVTIFLQFSSPGFWTATAALSGDNWQSAVYLHCSRSADLSRAPVHH